MAYLILFPLLLGCQGALVTSVQKARLCRINATVFCSFSSQSLFPPVLVLSHMWVVDSVVQMDFQSSKLGQTQTSWTLKEHARVCHTPQRRC